MAQEPPQTALEDAKAAQEAPGLPQKPPGSSKLPVPVVRLCSVPAIDAQFTLCSKRWWVTTSVEL